MQTGWDDSHVEQTRLIGLRAPLRVPNDKNHLSLIEFSVELINI
jgi:hypothetical protein